MRVHAIQTGTVRIKASQFEGRGPAPLRQLRDPDRPGVDRVAADPRLGR